jgi:hypothetical protein
MVGRAAELVGEERAGVLERRGAAADGPRHPVGGAEGVEDRALDPVLRVRLERDAARRVEPVDGLDEPHHRGGHQVVEVDPLGEPGVRAPRDGAGQGIVLGDE